ncbi:alkaline phosphatase PhoX [Nannocystis sp. SCPEA4]|uniref:alkaline phosphatase PhoX n=1 Tax=Nannocystis sp. SCPEA4 TaxID=2996787 RepID=UPI002270D212|nr:alkaline phosphatase PhoX [Nannocystis sp. SCPEA4]MCY1061736.1 DUF839 domain-containing protein [Nannocystis sp. SCPEA4]
MRPYHLMLKRRSFLRGGAAAAAAASLPLVFSYHRTARADYGALVPDPEGILDLPAGFTYTIVSQTGDTMTDGYRVPGAPDAMGAFPGPNNTVVLMCNHELSPGSSDSPYNDGQDPPPEAYDEDAVGGVTRIVLDNDTLEIVSNNLVLVGTIRNCAGGVSPWGWLSCEENVDDGHGYVFLCKTDAETVQMPERIVGYGRCNHEAACVDPDTFHAYLTEDRGDSCLYRFVPNDKADPFTGKLQALKVVGQDDFATTTMDVSEIVDCEWVDIDEPDPAVDILRIEAQGKGAAIFVRGEGIWWFEGAVYVCSTSGGPADGGQIFRLIDGPNGATLELIGRSDDKDLLDMPDNICVAPWGEVFMAEDGDGDNYVRVLAPTGEIYDFARNAQSDSEFAGVCFSPDGKTMFVNIQGDGITLAVRGPFPEVEQPGTTGDDTTGGDDTTSGGDDTTSDGSTGDAPTTSAGTAGGTEGDTGDPTTGGAPTSDGPSTSDGATDSSGGDTDSGGAGGDPAGCSCDADAGNPALDLALAAAGVAVLRSVTRPAPLDAEREPSEQSS